MIEGLRVVRLLAISGSLRSGSSNAALLQAASDLAPPGVIVSLYGGLAELPHFNPDLESQAMSPSQVVDLRDLLRAADGVLICSPEYAHGVPGSLKNALDWVVGSGELVDKAVALFNASPRANHAQDSLREILATMNARIVVEACLTVPLLGRKLDARGIAADPELSAALSSSLDAMARAIAPGPADHLT